MGPEISRLGSQIWWSQFAHGPLKFPGHGRSIDPRWKSHQGPSNKSSFRLSMLLGPPKCSFKFGYPNWSSQQKEQPQKAVCELLLFAGTHWTHMVYPNQFHELELVSLRNKMTRGERCFTDWLAPPRLGDPSVQ